MERPTDEALKYLITWPEGTLGYEREFKALVAIRDLCDVNGYGRIPQLASGIQDLWNNPERVEHYKKRQKERRDIMKSYMREND